MDKAVLTFAKMVVSSDGRNHAGITSDVYHKELEKLAKANKRDGESLQQTYVRLSQETETGALLLKAALSAPAPKQGPQDLVPAKKNPEPAGGPATAELNRMARAMVEAKGLSFESAFSRIWSDPSRASLVQRCKREIAEASREVKSQRWPIEQAERELDQDWSLGSARM